MKQWFVIGLALIGFGCSYMYKPVAASATKTVGDVFELMGREATVTFNPGQASIRISSMLALGPEGTGFSLKADKVAALNKIMQSLRSEVTVSSKNLTSARALLAMEYGGTRYLANANTPALQGARKALEVYMPHNNAIGPDYCWLMGRLQGSQKNRTVTVQKEKFTLTGSAADLVLPSGTLVLIVGHLQSEHVYAVTRMSQWMGPGSRGLDLPALEAEPAPAADYILDPATGLLTSRRRILVQLRERSGQQDIAQLLHLIGSHTYLVACWPDRLTVMLEIPDTPDLLANQNAVKKLSRSPLVESAVADVMMDGALSSFHRPGS